MKIIAHRGNKQNAPENTLSAFRSASIYPVDGIEFDVQFTKDGIPIVIHDERVDRTTNGSGFVRSFRWDELRQLDAGSWFHEQFKGERIPSLEDVLLWARGEQLILHIELKRQKDKTTEYIGAFLDLIESYGFEEYVIVSSFEHPYLAYIKGSKPNIRTAMLLKQPFFRAAAYAKRMKADAIHIRHSYQALRFYRGWTGKGLPVRAYNIRRMEEALLCESMGLESIITNDIQQITEGLRKTK